MPLIVVALPGRSHPYAVQVAAQAHDLGRHVLAVTADSDTDIARRAHAAPSRTGEIREVGKWLLGLYVLSEVELTADPDLAALLGQR
jgi:hypothetical protein